MRYFTRGWANGELSDEEAERVEDAYRARLSAIVPRLPTALRRLVEDVCLHDGVMESVRWAPVEKRLQLAFPLAAPGQACRTRSRLHRAGAH